MTVTQPRVCATDTITEHRLASAGQTQDSGTAHINIEAICVLAFQFDFCVETKENDLRLCDVASMENVCRILGWSGGHLATSSVFRSHYPC